MNKPENHRPESFSDTSKTTDCQITNSVDAYKYLMRFCFKEEDLWREKCFALFLNREEKVLGHTLISVGGFDKSAIDIKLVMKSAIDCCADSVILAHNHPNGNVLPSANDISETAKLRTACAALSIKMLDHIILSEKTYFAFSDEIVKKAPSRNELIKDDIEDAIRALLAAYPKTNRALVVIGKLPKQNNTHRTLAEINRLINTLRK